MGDLQSKLEEAVRRGDVPQAVVFAASADAKFNFGAAVGRVSSVPDAEEVREVAIFLLASQSKFVTTVAALKAVAKGLIGLDDDVAEHLPELTAQPILKGFEDEEPVFVPRKNAITLRHLVTHTSGLAYAMFYPTLKKYEMQCGTFNSHAPDVVSRYAEPILFEPGESWAYGTGIDWAGLLVERLTKTTLEEFMRENIWKPLGITSMTFFPEKQPELKKRMPQISVRGPDGKLVPYTDPFINEGNVACFGGQGIYSSMPDYLAFQLSILRNDSKILPATIVDDIFTPQLRGTASDAIWESLQLPMGEASAGEICPDIRFNWGLGGLLFTEDDVGRRKKGTMIWGGLTNCFWSIDRAAGLALAFGTQVLPPGDKRCEVVISEVERAVNALAGVYRSEAGGRS